MIRLHDRWVRETATGAMEADSHLVADLEELVERLSEGGEEYANGRLLL
jgi:hypothetical protein